METFIYWLGDVWYGIETELRWLWAEFAPIIVLFVLVFVYAFGVSTSKYFSSMNKDQNRS